MGNGRTGDRVGLAVAWDKNGQSYTRTLIETIADGIGILRQDVSEYAFIGLVGGAAAGIAVLVLGLIGSAIAITFIGPVLLLIALCTLAAAAAAVADSANHLQPDAAHAFAATARSAVAIIRPWSRLLVALAIASYPAAAFGHDLGPVPSRAIILAFAAISAAYALPRSFYCAAIFEHGLSARDALRVSSTLVHASTRPVVAAWCIVLAPAILIAMLGAFAGIDAPTGAVIAVLLAGAMPVGAALMSQIFLEVASALEANREPASPDRRSPWPGRG